MDMNSQISFIHFFQINFGPMGPFFQTMAFLGTAEFFLLVIPCILWNYNRSLGIRLLILISINGAINDALKLLFHQPRPYWISTDVKAISYYSSFGFPSGHAQNAVVFFGLLTSWVKKFWLRTLFILLIVLVGLARIFQGVHFPTDILGGFIFGLILLVLFLKFETPVKAWVQEKPLVVQLLMAFVTSAAFVLFSFLAYYSAGTWQVPPEWTALAVAQSGVAIHPGIPRDTLVSAGIFFGVAAGIIATSRHMVPDVKGTMAQYAARYLVGILILFGIWILLDEPGKAITSVGLGFVYLRSVIAGIWVTAGAPLLFKRLRLI